MAESREKHQAFIEVEYFLDKYFQRYFSPIVDRETKHLRVRQEEEVRGRGSDWGGFVDAASPFHGRTVGVSGSWNEKSSEHLLNTCKEQFFDNAASKRDFDVLVSTTKSALLNQLSEKEYIRLSQEAGGDLADLYVTNRFRQLFVEKLASRSVPRGSIDYILRHGFNDSLIGFLFSPDGSKSDLDKEIAATAEHLYDPSLMEKAAAGGLSIGIDLVTLPPGSSVAKGTVTAGRWALGRAGTDALFRVGVEAFGSDGLSSFDKDFSKKVFGDKDVVGSYRQLSKTYDPSGSKTSEYLNGILSRPVIRKTISHDNINNLCRSLKEKVSLEGMEQFCSRSKEVYAKTGIRVKDHILPLWYDEKSDAELYHGAMYWTSYASEMKAKGVSKVKFGGRTYTVHEVAQKGYDYARALHQRQEDRSVAVTMDNPLGLEKEDPLAHKTANVREDRSVAVTMDNPLGLEKEDPLAHKTASVKEEQVSPLPDVSGWSDVADKLGMTGFGDIGKNLGYVLATLPDMLIGLFTGRTQGLSIKNSLFPLAAIIGGMFVRNPLLKLLLIGLGGANILNKVGHERLEKDGVIAAPSKTYLRRDDEPLDARISQPVLRGRTMLMTIDGNQYIATLGDRAVDAYEKGALPLNTLANAILRKYDEQRPGLGRFVGTELSENVREERQVALR